MSELKFDVSANDSLHCMWLNIVTMIVFDRQLFTRLLRSLNLPVGTGTLGAINVKPNDNNSYEAVLSAIWIANMLVCEVFF